MRILDCNPHQHPLIICRLFWDSDMPKIATNLNGCYGRVLWEQSGLSHYTIRMLNITTVNIHDNDNGIHHFLTPARLMWIVPKVISHTIHVLYAGETINE